LPAVRAKNAIDGLGNYMGSSVPHTKENDVSSDEADSTRKKLVDNKKSSLKPKAKVSFYKTLVRGDCRCVHEPRSQPMRNDGNYGLHNAEI
jgi:hypothetical protein